MAPTDLKALREISPDPAGFSQSVTNRLKMMITGLSRLYLASINYTFKLRYTSNILFYVSNSDAEKENRDVFFTLGNENTPAGAMKAWVSERDLLKLSDHDKGIMLLGIIHDSLKQLAETTGHEVELLDKAYKDSRVSDFYYDSYKEYKSMDGKFVVQIQSKENWGSANHRLTVRSSTTKTSKYYPINSTAYPFFDEIPGLTPENMWPVVLKTPQTFDPVKWQGNEFVAYWGKEKFVFDLEKETLTKE